MENVVGEALELVVRGRTDQGKAPVPVLGADRIDREVDLDTLVAHGTDIRRNARGKVRRDGHVVVTQQVDLVAVEVVDATGDTIFEEAEVQTDILVVTLLPAKVGVHVSARAPDLETTAIVLPIAERAIG